MRQVPIPDPRTVAAALVRAPLFQPLGEERAERVAHMATAVQYEPKETIVREGERSDAFYVLMRGEAVVQVEPPGGGAASTVAHLAQLDVIGELGLILGTPRTATVVAETQVLALRFGEDVFVELFRRIPEFGLAVCRVLAKRVADASHQVPLVASDVADPDPDLVSRLPLPFLQNHRVLPLRLKDDQLEMGFVRDPSTQVLEAVRRLMPGVRILPVRIPAALADRVLDATAHPAPATTPGAAGSAAGRLDRLLYRMVREGASDLHLSAGGKPRWRVDGQVSEVPDGEPLGPSDVRDMMRPLLNDDQSAEFESGGDLDFAHGVPGLARFRVNLFRDIRGVCAVLRQIPEKVLPLDKLDLPPVVMKLCEYPKGLVLVTGPTGSGKSTTLAAMIDALNKKRKGHIITLEDPVEFVHASAACLVNQREVGTHTKSFSRALKSALREDPDIVLVGEMRDLETISLALETANTGHLVFGTLHTSTAISTVDRIVNLFPAEQQAQVRATLGDVLKGVVSQALCRRIGGGRVAAVEVMVVNAAIANLVREGKTHQIASIMSTGGAAGNCFLNASLERLVKSGAIEADEAMSHALDKADMARRLGIAPQPAGG
ncbi:MAG: PilT/PilU family type 4a pilus ATPase [Deltaproteobacteria bacterium]|nr:PilT/PilU family type 4a pilus ATPase [Deltaproteobacteria bacterium]